MAGATKPGRGAKRHRSNHDRLLRAEARARALDAAGPGRLRRLTRRLGWPLVFAGSVLFVTTYVGATAGFTVLPFDRHHFVGQMGGAIVALIGVRWATRRAERP